PSQDALYADIDLALSWSERDLPERERTKHVHRLHPYLGKFILQAVEELLARIGDYEHADVLRVVLARAARSARRTTHFDLYPEILDRAGLRLEERLRRRVNRRTGRRA